MGTPIQPTFEGDFVLAADAPFALESGGQLQPVTLRYATYGKLNAQRDNAVLVCHALSGSARIADWWEDMFRADGAFDVERQCYICVNVIGSCYGSTGPSSINARTGEPYGPDFPLITIRDMVRAQGKLLEHLGVEQLQAVLGGSIGGMQALQWAVEFPERVENCISIGSCALSAMGLALNHLQRQAILLDPEFCSGRYERQPAGGLALARQIAMCSYKSAELFAERYGRRPNRRGEDPYQAMNGRFDVAGYLDHQGDKFVARFDANTYLTISKAMDAFDLARGFSSEDRAFRRIRAKVLLIGISSDWLFPAAEVRALCSRMRAAGGDSEYRELTSSHGHDGFLADPEALTALLRPVLNSADGRARAKVLKIG